MTAAPKRLGYDDLLRLGGGRHHELVAGALEEKASPSPAHGRAQRSLAGFSGGPSTTKTVAAAPAAGGS